MFLQVTFPDIQLFAVRAFKRLAFVQVIFPLEIFCTFGTLPNTRRALVTRVNDKRATFYMFERLETLSVVGAIALSEPHTGVIQIVFFEVIYIIGTEPAVGAPDRCTFTVHEIVMTVIYFNEHNFQTHFTFKFGVLVVFFVVTFQFK